MANPEKIPWRTVPYIAPNGCCEVLDYLDALREKDLRAWQQFENIRQAFETRGPFMVGPPHWKGLGGELFEIRWRRHRIYCSVEDPRRVMMYVAVYKLWDKFRASDRNKCLTRRADTLSADYDEEQRKFKYLAYCQRRGKNGSI